MKKHTLALVLILFTPAVIGAAEDKTIDSRKQHCSDSEETMSACRSFIKGFLQGALLTDTAIINSIEKTEPGFAERAFRTRIGSRYSSPTALAGFCLPDDRSILELAEETLDHVKASERNSNELAKNVYKSLRTDYSCK